MLPGIAMMARAELGGRYYKGAVISLQRVFAALTHMHNTQHITLNTQHLG